jgi:hypothetical protein
MFVAVGTLAAALMNSGSMPDVVGTSGDAPTRARWFGPAHLTMLLFSLWVVLPFFTAIGRWSALVHGPSSCS